jgi:hypothetical protein
MANRLFFRLYQCANMLHKTGSRAIEEHGLTTQQWAVMGALSRPAAVHGMSVGDLARYLMVSRQNLSGVIGRMERDGHLRSAPGRGLRPAELRACVEAQTRRGTSQSRAFESMASLSTTTSSRCHSDSLQRHRAALSPCTAHRTYP